MHTEHLQNVTFGRVFAGWLVAVAVTSLVTLAFTSFGIVSADATASTWAGVVTVAIGFFAGGFFAGFRALQAPILHAVAMGLTTLVVWVALNTIILLFNQHWEFVETSPNITATLMLVQIVAAMIGALLGYNMALRGKPGLSEHEPV